jgi:Fe-S oxidoreductase
MRNHTDTTYTTYDVTDPNYWNPQGLERELERVFDICIGCRLCFNLCPSFPALFRFVDAAGEEKRRAAVAAGRVGEAEADREYKERPEGKHAVEASIEVEFRGEVEDLTEAQIQKVVDLCYQCKLCDSVCPYTPAKGHEFQLDFPKLMLRAKAIQARKEGVRWADRLIARTDFMGKMGSWTVALANWGNSNRLVRGLLQAVLGIHRDRELPRYYFETFDKWFRKHSRNHSMETQPVAKAALLATCFVNYNDPALGRKAVEVLEHNGVEVVVPTQRCCGAPFLSNGDMDGFVRQAESNLRILAEWVDRGYPIVVLGPPTCSLTLKQEYPYLLKQRPELRDMAAGVSAATRDISEFLMELHKTGNLKTDFRQEVGMVNYHVSCHQKAQNIGFKSRDLLRLIPNTKIRMINRCSGMDGGWGMKQRFFDASAAVGRRCVQDLEKRPADTVCSDCTLAGMQLRQVSERRMEPEHPIAVLHRCYGLDDFPREEIRG